jgi:hypothetical protein
VVDDDEPFRLDGLRVCFGDERAGSDAGVMLDATLTGRLGVEGWRGDWSSCGGPDRAGAANAVRKVPGAELRDGARRRQHR